MTVETATYIADLQANNPAATDQVSQGDDHLRLIKGVLQNTFPNANKVNYFPAATAGPTGALSTSVQNSVLFYDTSGGNVPITLPSLTSSAAGWMVGVIKTSIDANAVTVNPPTGTILSQFGAVASIRVGAVCSSARFIWTGTTWICSKDGPLIGSTTHFDGPSLPAGHLVLDGSSFSGTTYAELAAALGGTTLFDKRGRVEYGVDSGQVNLNGTNGWGGVAPTLGTTHGGNGYVQLTAAQMAPYTAGGSVNTSISVSNYGNTTWFILTGAGGASGSGAIAYGGVSSGGANVTNPTISASSTFSGGTSNGGSSSPVAVTGPGIITQKIIRAC